APIDPATAFTTTRATPPNGMMGVRTTPVTVTFSRAINIATLSSDTFRLYRFDGTDVVPVAATVSYDGPTRKATLTPSMPLTPLTQHYVKVVGGVDGVASDDGQTLAGDGQWAFVTASDSTAALAAAYGFNEGTDVTTADDSGNGNNGTLIGGTTW